MDVFLQTWGEAAYTSAGFFWMALWAFALGYLISSLIQVLVTRQRMQQTMGKSGPRSIARGTFFGFISSSCSFAALATTRSLFQKGAGFVPAMAFLLSSTNLVIELGIVIALFLSWQFVVGEYLGGLLLVGFAWLYVRLTRPDKLIRAAREKLGESSDEQEDTDTHWKQKATSLAGWRQIGMQYVMEWQMVWKDVLVGFTVAGIIAAFVPDTFFTTLFVGSGDEHSQNPGFLAVLTQTLVGPLAAFFTFIGSMGNIPLAALLFDNGVSFAGIMAFIFSDLVVFPILRINAEYYGWKMAFYILGMLLTCLIAASLLLHYGFLALDLLPTTHSHGGSEREFFKLDYGFVLNIIALLTSVVLGWLWWQKRTESSDHHHHEGSNTSLTDRVLQILSVLAILWLVSGLLIRALGIGGG